MKTLQNEKGSTLVELVMVMTLMVLFGVTIFTLIFTGADTQKRIMAEKDSQMDARSAVSYLNVRLRQNDSLGKIEVVKNNLTNEDSILIKERSLEGDYDTWIFYLDGKLLECLVEPGGDPTEIDSFQIVAIDGFETKFNKEDGSISNTVFYDYGDERREISTTMYLKSFSNSNL